MVERLVTAHTRGERNYTTEIHKLLKLELLHRNFIDSEMGVRSSSLSPRHSDASASSVARLLGRGPRTVSAGPRSRGAELVGALASLVFWLAVGASRSGLGVARRLRTCDGG